MIGPDLRAHGPDTTDLRVFSLTDPHSQQAYYTQWQCVSSTGVSQPIATDLRVKQPHQTQTWPRTLAVRPYTYSVIVLTLGTE